MSSTMLRGRSWSGHPGSGVGHTGSVVGDVEDNTEAVRKKSSPKMNWPVMKRAGVLKSEAVVSTRSFHKKQESFEIMIYGTFKNMTKFPLVEPPDPTFNKKKGSSIVLGVMGVDQDVSTRRVDAEKNLKSTRASVNSDTPEDDLEQEIQREVLAATLRNESLRIFGTAPRADVDGGSGEEPGRIATSKGVSTSKSTRDVEAPAGGPTTWDKSETSDASASAGGVVAILSPKKTLAKVGNLAVNVAGIAGSVGSNVGNVAGTVGNMTGNVGNLAGNVLTSPLRQITDSSKEKFLGNATSTDSSKDKSKPNIRCTEQHNDNTLVSGVGKARVRRGDTAENLAAMATMGASTKKKGGGVFGFEDVVRGLSKSKKKRLRKTLLVAGLQAGADGGVSSESTLRSVQEKVQKKASRKSQKKDSRVFIDDSKKSPSRISKFSATSVGRGSLQIMKSVYRGSIETSTKKIKSLASNRGLGTEGTDSSKVMIPLGQRKSGLSSQFGSMNFQGPLGLPLNIGFNRDGKRSSSAPPRGDASRAGGGKQSLSNSDDTGGFGGIAEEEDEDVFQSLSPGSTAVTAQEQSDFMNSTTMTGGWLSKGLHRFQIQKEDITVPFNAATAGAESAVGGAGGSRSRSMNRGTIGNTKAGLNKVALPFFKQLRMSGVQQIACGPEFFAILTVDGSVGVYGWNLSYVTGYTSEFLVLKMPVAGVNIAVGNAHTMIVGQDGLLYGHGDVTMFGLSQKDQEKARIALSEDTGSCTRIGPRNYDSGNLRDLVSKAHYDLLHFFSDETTGDVYAPIPVNCCASKARYSVCATFDGLLYHWGYVPFLCKNLMFPTVMHICPTFEDNTPNGIRQIACSACATLVLDNDGFVYAWGDGTYGEVATGSSLGGASSMTYGTCLEIDEPILEISCGDRHTICLGTSGQLYAFGDDTYGQCGIKYRSINTAVNVADRILVPRVVSIDYGKNIITANEEFEPFRASAGRSHSCLLTEAGNLYAWGDTAMIPLQEDPDEVVMVEKNKGVAIESGIKHSVNRPKLCYHLCHRFVHYAECGPTYTVVIFGSEDVEEEPEQYSDDESGAVTGIRK